MKELIILNKCFSFNTKIGLDEPDSRKFANGCRVQSS